MDSPFPPPIVTDRLILRVLDARDAPALLALYGDARVMHHWNHAPWQSMQQALAAIDEARRDYRQGASLHLAITLRAGGELIGSCALYDFTPVPRRALLGYLLAQRHWGHGYAGEALRGLARSACRVSSGSKPKWGPATPRPSDCWSGWASVINTSCLGSGSWRVSPRMSRCMRWRGRPVRVYEFLIFQAGFFTKNLLRGH